MSKEDERIEFAALISRIREDIYRLKADFSQLKSEVGKMKTDLSKLQTYWEGIGK